MKKKCSFNPSSEKNEQRSTDKLLAAFASLQAIPNYS